MNSPFENDSLENNSLFQAFRGTMIETLRLRDISPDDELNRRCANMANTLVLGLAARELADKKGCSINSLTADDVVEYLRLDPAKRGGAKRYVEDVLERIKSLRQYGGRDTFSEHSDASDEPAEPG